MKRKAVFLLLATALLLFAGPTKQQYCAATRISLREAVQLALKHNHNVRIGGYAVDEKQHAKRAAKVPISHRYQCSSFLRVTDTQLIQIKPGSWVQRGDADSSCEQRP